MIPSVVTKEEFHKAIEDIVWDLDCTYVEAAMNYANKVGMDPESVGEMIKRDPVLKSKFQEEAEKAKLVEVIPKLEW